MSLEFHVRLPRSGRVRFSPDGALCAVASHHATQLIDPRTGRVVQELWAGHWPSEIAFSPDGRTLAARMYMVLSICVARWDGEEFVEAENWESEDDAWGLEFSPDGDYLIVGTQRGFEVMDPKTGDVEFSYVPGRGERLCGSDCIPGGAVWVTAEHRQPKKNVKENDATLRRWTWPFDKATCETLPYRVPYFHALALHPKGDLVAALFGDSEARAVMVQVYSQSRRMILHSQPGRLDPTVFLRWSGCGRYLAMSTQDGAGVGLLDFEARSMAIDFRVGKIEGNSVSDWPSDVDWSPDGKLLAVAAPRGGIASVPGAVSADEPPRR